MQIEFVVSYKQCACACHQYHSYSLVSVADYIRSVDGPKYQLGAHIMV
jgi:hypothetical protein